MPEANIRAMIAAEAGRTVYRNVQHFVARSLPAIAKNATDQVHFGVTLVFRAYYRRTLHELRPEKFRGIWQRTKIELREFLSRRIRENIMASLDKGGTLRGDVVMGGTTWAEWSPAYRKWRRYRPGVAQKLGYYTGEMASGIEAADLEGAVIVRFRGSGEGKVADDISIDFAGTGVGEKMARFHHGSWKQPERPFTFLTMDDLDEVRNHLAETIRNFDQRVHAILFGVREGVLEMSRGPKGVKQEMALVRLGKRGASRVR